MSRTVVLTSCVKTKQTDGQAHAAADLYTSPLFKGMRAYAEREGHAWFILSAAHGLVYPGQELEAYEQTLSTMTKAARLAWSAKVLEQLATRLMPGDRVVILAGMAYREFLVDELRARGHMVDVPMARLQLGEQKSWLNKSNAQENTENSGITNNGPIAPEVPPCTNSQTAAPTTPTLFHRKEKLGGVGFFRPTTPPQYPTPLFSRQLGHA